jgi:ABC-2 type transport system ATP-binding protein
VSKNIPLRVETLTKSFESSSWWGGTQETFVAVKGISFELNPGEILGLLGPNGAGKTTTIHMLLGVTEVTSGTITYFGKNFKKHRSTCMRQVAFASTYSRLMSRLTVYENLAFHAQLYGMKSLEQKKRIDRFLSLFGIDYLRDRLAAGLSAGENTRALLAKAFLPYPRIVLLDEPTAALDPDIANVVRTFVLEQRRDYEVSMLFTSHNMDEVSQLCDRVLVLKDGSIIASETPEVLAASVSKARVHLMSDQTEAIVQLARSQGLKATIQEHALTIEMDEKRVAQFLPELTRNNLSYTQITIDKPRLEDYFLEIAQRKGPE